MQLKTVPKNYKCTVCGRETYNFYDRCLDCKEEKPFMRINLDERKYFVVFEHADEIIVTVKDDVNRPNNPDCEQVLSEWLSENYGSDEYEYWEITNIEKISL